MFKNKRNDTDDKGPNKLLLGIVAIAAMIFILPQILGGDALPEQDLPTQDEPQVSTTTDNGNDLGRIVVAENLDRNGCPLDSTSTLSNPNQFYVVAPNSEISEGTDVFVRLYQDGRAVEDLPIITANQDYDNTCINFVFETTDGFAFDRGEYEAEFWVNGNSYDSTYFVIQ